MATKKILCIGGAGQLGRIVVKSLLPYEVTNIDFNSCDAAKVNINLDLVSTPIQNNHHAISELKDINNTFDSILVTAGRWAGGTIADEDYIAKCLQMIDINLNSCLLGAHLATNYLKKDGLVVFTGAAVVFHQPQPDMIGYAIAKAGIYSLTLNLADHFRKNGHNGKVVTILPETIDTEVNRAAMPQADFSKWSKPQQIGKLLRGWVDGEDTPKSGSFALLKVTNEQVTPEIV